MELRFTKEEFDTMVDELLYRTPVSFDMLCTIAEKTLKPSVVKWCKNDPCLRGRGFEEDVMQEIHLRLIKTTVNNFLLRDGVTTPYNDDPEGFEDWLFKVAENKKRDFANAVRNRDFKVTDLDHAGVDALTSDLYGDASRKAEHQEILKQAFAIVLSADAGVYKVLTWLAQFLIVLEQDVTKIKSNDLIIAAYEDKTLYDMYDMLLTAAKKIPWIVITPEQNENILRALRKKRVGTVSYGVTKYKDFFMKHNGEISGKKSISDWVNRMNGIIKRRIGESDAETDRAQVFNSPETQKKGERK